MIHFIKGTLVLKTEKGIVVETGGIGYNVSVPGNSAVYLKNEGDEVKVFTAMIVREDDISLYGFSDSKSLEMFNLLITISGVGAKAAMAIMSAMPLAEVKQSIATGDVAMITRANGVGKKTAQRIVLELKDKIGPVEDIVMPAGEDSGAVVFTDERNEAVSGLIALGYTKAEALAALKGVDDNSLTADQYIRKALSNLM